jgi:hypothetical protein
MGGWIPYLAISNLSKSEQKRHSLPLILKFPAPLLVMARDSDHNKPPWGEGSSHDRR